MSREAGKRGFGDGKSNKTLSRNAMSKPRIELVSVTLTVIGWRKTPAGSC
jgi:hypothetical protein